MSTLPLSVTELDTPAGAIVFARRGERLVALSFKDHWPRLRKELEKRFGALELTPDANGGSPGRALRRYLGGDLGALDALEVDTEGTPFQEKVWSRLRRIPVGATLSYAELARAIGKPSAVRAVAGANARNPVSVVVPCHRVIASDGKLAGYGGGVSRKRWLLAHEGAIIA
ncbi:MAG TPA: methylated-DNA--[protein]-cysteine S-methyltransferase [Thermoanaerobaculia bacterium]|nr:methylated-DNA--[protein]-cysteine S-methyltransferase [Thermoanaerobaculia bacterium]